MPSNGDREILDRVSFDDWKRALELAGRLRLGDVPDPGALLPEDENVDTALAYMTSWRLLVLCSGLKPPLGLARTLAEGLYPQVHAITPEASYDDLHSLLSAIGAADPQSPLINTIRDGAGVYLGLVGALFWYDETFVEFERHLYATGLV